MVKDEVDRSGDSLQFSRQSPGVCLFTRLEFQTAIQGASNATLMCLTIFFSVTLNAIIVKTYF